MSGHKKIFIEHFFVEIVRCSLIVAELFPSQDSDYSGQTWLAGTVFIQLHFLLCHARTPRRSEPAESRHHVINTIEACLGDTQPFTFEEPIETREFLLSHDGELVIEIVVITAP